MPGPWRLARNGLFVLCNDNFNLRRDARPLATIAAQHGLDLIIVISISDEMPGPWRPYAILQRHSKIGGFQSQTRCQAPGDVYLHTSRRESEHNFNLRRDARPLATLTNNQLKSCQL